MASALARNSVSCSLMGRLPGPEERVLRPAEPPPQVLVDARGARAGGLPPGHQIPVGAGRRTPVGRSGQGLGLGDQLLLGHPGGLAFLGLLGELGLPPPGVGRPGAEKRCQSSSSVARSSRGSAFHSSSRARNRLTPPRQSLPAASRSASSTNRCLLAFVSSPAGPARPCGRPAARRRPPPAPPGERSDRPGHRRRARRSASARTVRIEDGASSGDRAPDGSGGPAGTTSSSSAS